MKKKVSFDESKNVVKEFAKNEQIQSTLSQDKNAFASPQKKSNKKNNKSDSKKENTKPDQASKDSASASSKKQMTAEKVESISKLKSSEAVLKAKDDMLLKEAPNNSYQFERDFKSIKNDKERKLAYVMNIKPSNFKNIFKTDLEADIMLQIFKTYLDQESQGDFFKTNSQYLIEVLSTFQSVSAFELSCDFLMDDEKSVIKELVNALEPHAVKDEFTKVKDKFASVCGIEF